MDKQLSSECNLSFLNEEQEKCYNEIQINDSILVLKERMVGTTSFLKKYVTNELLKGKNKTICFMSSLYINTIIFRKEVGKLIKETYGYECTESTNALTITSNNNRLVCLRNNSDSFYNLHQIDIFIYDEIGFEKDNFDALIKTLELYKQISLLKIIFTYTIEANGKALSPCNNMVWEWLLTNDFKKVKMTEMLNLKELQLKESLFDNINKIYNER